MTHYLKIDPIYINEIINGNKVFEVRKNDRNFQEGDKIVFQEYWNSKYLERRVIAEITYILHSFIGLKEGYVVLGIKVLYNLSREEKIREQIEVNNKEIKENLKKIAILNGKIEALLEMRERLETLVKHYEFDKNQ